MAKAVQRPAGSWTYILKSDEHLPIGQQSRFVLKPLTGAERDAVTDNLAVTRTTSQGVEIQRRMRQESRVLCLTHIVSIDNFPSERPKPWPDKEEDRAKYLELLDDEFVFELGNQIFEQSNVLAPRDAAVSPTLPPADTSSSDATLAASTSMIAPNASEIPS
jgi:hypothetical protein